MTLLTENAPAKVNLSLHVGPPKLNGRHNLISLVSFGDSQAADMVTARPASHFSLAVEGPFAEATGPARDNLILQAARAIDEALDGSAPKLAFRLTKTLPCAGGIGGGSADAAAALRLIIRAHGGDEALAIARQVAPSIGGDVLACLTGLPGIMSGEGEHYEPLLGLPPLPILLVNSGHACPTGPVFHAYDDTAPAVAPEHPLPPAGRAREADFIEWLAQNTTNSLEAAAIRLVPEIAQTLDRLRALQKARLVRMSGSGTTCFAVFDRIEDAETAMQALLKDHPEWWIKATLLGGG